MRTTLKLMGQLYRNYSLFIHVWMPRLSVEILKGALYKFRQLIVYIMFAWRIHAIH